MAPLACRPGLPPAALRDLGGQRPHVLPIPDGVDKGAADHHAVRDRRDLPGGGRVLDAEAHRDGHPGMFAGQGDEQNGKSRDWIQGAGMSGTKAQTHADRRGKAGAGMVDQGPPSGGRTGPATD